MGKVFDGIKSAAAERLYNAPTIDTKAVPMGPQGVHSPSKSFVDVVKGGKQFLAMPLPSSKPNKNGDVVSVQLIEAAYAKRLNLCQHSLIARVILGKGEAQWKLAELNDKLYKVWNLNNWILISMGKCYF